MTLATSDTDFYEQSIQHPDRFWAQQAKLIDWFTPFTRVCNNDTPRWCTGLKAAPPTCVTTRWTGI